MSLCAPACWSLAWSSSGRSVSSALHPGGFFWLSSSETTDLAVLDPSGLPSVGGDMTCLPLIPSPGADASGAGVNEWNSCLLVSWLGDCLVDGAFFSSCFFPEGMWSGIK